MFILREYILRYLALIPSDKRIRSLDYQLCRTIVLLQFKEFGILVLCLKIEDVVDIGPTEGIDTLRIVTHNAHTLSLFCQLIDDSLLGKVCILILINKYELELLNIFLSNVLMFSK